MTDEELFHRATWSGKARGLDKAIPACGASGPAAFAWQPRYITCNACKEAS